MRVLHIVSSLPSEKRPFDKPFVLSQIESLRKNGIEIDVMNLQAKDNTLNYFTGILKIWHRCNKTRYDLIHAHYSYCGWSAVFQKKVPVVVSLMGNDLYGILNNKGGQTLIGFLNIISTKILIKLVDAVIVKSRPMQEMINANHVFVVPNGVDFEKFKPMDRKNKTNNFDSAKMRQVLFLGDPKNRRKNVSLARKAIEIVQSSNSDVELLTVFGVGQEKIIEFMISSGLLLLTSLQEGSPNVIKEAMACNMPIVATDVGDVRELIGNTSGCYITSFEPDDVAAKIRAALAFGNRTNGRDQIRHLEINTIAKKIVSIYEWVISNR